MAAILFVAAVLMPFFNSDGSLFNPPRRPAPPRPSYDDELADNFYRQYMDGLAEWERWRQARREQQEQGETEREP